ncbi:MAG TPA: hypothetical protein VHD38_02770 [Candidatus Paceibacterota bacterium]|jgi:hypothetical protein|nr:hypothetical protein [Candidatus Paceibacterota bacterium]
MRHSLHQRGITTIMVVGFMGVFMLIMAMLTSYAFEQAKYGRALLAREQALSIAEAGLEYYRWFLSHNPGNVQNGTGLPGPYTYTVSDPEGGTLGTASLTVTGNYQCSTLQNIDITSKGAASNNPSYSRTVSTRYMQHNVAEYAFLSNSNVWFSSSNTSVGPYFSNGGIREDGTNNSIVGSALANFSCDSSMGCSPTQSKPGVFGAGSGSALWQYPVSSIDFSGIATNFNTLKTYAQTSGRYFQDNTVSSNHDSMGYHIVLKSDGTFDAYKVTGTQWVYGYRSNGDCSSGGGWCTDYDIITSQTYLGNYTIPSTCGLVYVQGTLWLEGTLKGKLTIVAADPSTTYAPDILIANNIAYAATDGTTGLTAIAEHSVRIALNVPDTLNIRGIFVAQSGYYGQDYHLAGYTNGYDSYIVRSNLNVIGSLVSNQKAGVQWVDGSGNTVSGFRNRTSSYDQVLAFNPPPFTPAVSSDYHYALWNEQ